MAENSSLILDIFSQLSTILRYFAPPILALMLLWAFNPDHDAIHRILESAWPGHFAWVLAVFVPVLGLFTYSAHRIVFHRPLSKLTARFFKQKRKALESDAVNFARWSRRAAKADSKERAVQAELDIANAASHFFYCSGWAALLIVLFVAVGFPGVLAPSWKFWIAVVVLLVLGFIGDLQTTVLDIKAFDQFSRSDVRENCRAGDPDAK